MSSKSTAAITNIALMIDKLTLGDSADATTARAASLTLLIEQARSGDKAAFELLMMLREQRIARVAWRLLGNTEDTRDAVQEVFMRTYKYLHRFKQEQDFDAWLYRITINVCRDIARRSRRHVHDQLVEFKSVDNDVDEQTSQVGTADDAEARLLYAERRSILDKAIATLSEKERQAITLRDLEGLSTEEVARILGTRAATVRSQISQARRKIKIYCERFLHNNGG